MKYPLILIALLFVSCGGQDDENLGSSSCQDGGVLLGSAGVEQWCAIPDGYDGWIRHGLYREWNQLGFLAVEGHYCNGSKCDSWFGWRGPGQPLYEMYFTENGEQCGTHIRWDEEGNKTETEYDPC